MREQEILKKLADIETAIQCLPERLCAEYRKTKEVERHVHVEAIKPIHRSPEKDSH